MSKTLTVGHRVRFIDDERLDIPDAQAMQSLGLDYANELAAAIFGGDQASGATAPVAGSLCDINLDSTTPTATVVQGPTGAGKRAMFVHTYEVEAGLMETEILVYDPTLTGQQTTVELPLTYASTSFPALWVARIAIDDDTDTRRKWDTGTSTEVLTSLATRERYRLQFVFRESVSSPPSAEAGWFPIGVVTNYSNVLTGSNATFSVMHPFDAGVSPENTGYAAWGTGLPTSGKAGPLHTDLRFIGASQGFHQIAKTLANIQSRDASGNNTVMWDAVQAVGGIKEHDSRITAVENFFEFMADSGLNLVLMAAGSVDTFTSIPGSVTGFGLTYNRVFSDTSDPLAPDVFSEYVLPYASATVQPLLALATPWGLAAEIPQFDSIAARLFTMSGSWWLRLHGHNQLGASISTNVTSSTTTANPDTGHTHGLPQTHSPTNALRAYVVVIGKRV